MTETKLSSFGSFEIRIWCLFGHWGLMLGHSSPWSLVIRFEDAPQPLHDRLRRRRVGRQRNAVHVADPHQSAHVGLVRLGSQGIAEEDHRPDLSQGYAG